MHAAPFAADVSKWDAVRRRDSAADPFFLYAVRTTGVYCFPSCSARPARPENVEFYPTAAAAEKAGFRPCRRCRPDLPPRAVREAEIVTAACRAIEQAEETPPLKELAAQAGLSRYHFHRLFRRVAGVTPKAYAMAQRESRIQARLRSGTSVTEAIYAAGYNSSARFYEAARDTLGMTPSIYRRGGDGEALWHATGRCSLGYVLAAATARGICAILLGDDPKVLAFDLRCRFPKAKLTEPEPQFEAWLEYVIRFVDDPSRSPDFELPLDIRGTAFQRRIWEILREIPAGRTASYSEIAARAGNPRSVRAVAAACAANAVAVAIPCHRVIASDGKLAGYRWGLERKRILLDRERQG